MKASGIKRLKLQYDNLLSSFAFQFQLAQLHAGAAEKVRFALLLGKVPFKDTRVAFAEWGEMKASTPYGQLPVMVVDGRGLHSFTFAT